MPAIFLVVVALALALAVPVQAAGPPPRGQVDFERHVMGLLSRAGCNAGACHGSFQGKNGFRLSLFGADPARDHIALTRDVQGRRVNPLDPDRSLMILKATGQLAHGGGRRFSPGSWQHQLLRAWIADGAAWHKGSGGVARLTLVPDGEALIPQGQTGRVRAIAHFADGSDEDVTHLCDFRAQDEAVARVQEPGAVRAGRPGDTALLVSYRGNVRALRVLVPVPARPGFRYPNIREANYIDREVFARLRRLNVVPSEQSSDAEFLRRVTIDTIGSLPAPEEVRRFLADTDPKKRDKKIDQLLAHPLHAALWATRLSDITGNNTAALRGSTRGAEAKYSQMWHDWFRQRLADNTPYDQIVKGVLTATSRDGRSREEWLREVEDTESTAAKTFVTSYARKASLDLFWKIGKAPTLEQLAERTASAFLGVRLECAQCHKHPFDRWTQADYRAYANLFGHVVVGMAPDTAQALGVARQKGKPHTKKIMLPKGAGLLNEVFLGGKGRQLPPPDYVPVVKAVVVNAKGKKQLVLAQPPPPLLPRALGGPVIPLQKGRDARVALFEWMRAPDNPYFARSFVNRVWGHYFGVGIVHPVDDFSLANPPSNARLLDALAASFVRSGYDIRALERTILLSRTYQLSSTMNETNRLDRNNFSHSYLRPLLAEVVVDVLGDAVGVPDDFGKDAPAGKRAIEVGASRILDPDLGYVLRTFGRPERALPCDCERSPEPSLAQTLYRMADPALLQKFSAAVVARKVKVKGKGKPAVLRKGRLVRLLESSKSSEEIVEELFLATLSRFPTKAEKDHFATYQSGRNLKRDEACNDALWALLNTREFILNH
jgi:hypothetical protein